MMLTYIYNVVLLLRQDVMTQYVVALDHHSMTMTDSLSAFNIDTDVFAGTVVPFTELAGSDWNKYVYRAYSGANVNQDTCTAMCVFDYYNSKAYTPYLRCQFRVSDSTTCYLGTLQKESAVLASPLAKGMLLMTRESPDI
jgi:hypothetical protein